jgi:GTP-binding protein EngB required for normal cell division
MLTAKNNSVGKTPGTTHPINYHEIAHNLINFTNLDFMNYLHALKILLASFLKALLSKPPTVLHLLFISLLRRTVL